ncbi:hypothetical protein LUTEI9C_70149 [Luteimonas sp. 9C]|nr:hypothetical protein LUTEI9C_70149 [Luteimonas sp. 9C]
MRGACPAGRRGRAARRRAGHRRPRRPIGCARSRYQLPRRQRLRGQERRQLLRLPAGLRQCERAGRSAGGAGRLRTPRHRRGLRLRRDPVLRLRQLALRGARPGQPAALIPRFVSGNSNAVCPGPPDPARVGARTRRRLA